MGHVQSVPQVQKTLEEKSTAERNPQQKNPFQSQIFLDVADALKGACSDQTNTLVS
jgi:hypothetical protein